MARLNSQRELGGAIGDIFVDQHGTWELRAIYSDGRYAWSLIDKQEPADQRSKVDAIDELTSYIRDIDKRLTLIEGSVQMLVSRITACEDFDAQLSDLRSKIDASSFEAIQNLAKAIAASNHYVGTEVPPIKEAVQALAGLVIQIDDRLKAVETNDGLVR